MSLSINRVPLDDHARPYIIAEISGNHHQDYVTAQNLVRAAAEAGADACKFQTFTTEAIAAPDIKLLLGHPEAPKGHDAWLMSMGALTLRDLMSHGGLPRKWHRPLKTLAADLGITFFSTPFSLEDGQFLVEEVEVPALKIASGDLLFEPLTTYADSTGLPILLSTGGATIDEVERVAMFGFEDAWMKRLVLLHCCCAYPAPDQALNLRAIRTLQDLQCPVGYSDHSLDWQVVPALAVANGAVVIEKHLRLEGDTTSIDAGHSLTPSQFATMVQTIRRVPTILGDGIVQPHALALHDRLWGRRDPSDWLRPMQRAREGDWQ